MRRKLVLVFFIILSLVLFGFLYKNYFGKDGKKVLVSPKTVNKSRLKKEDSKKEGEVLKINLLFGGEIILARTVAVNIDRMGVDYPFKEISFWVRKADLAFATLESPVLGEGKPCLDLVNCMVFVGREDYLKGVKNAGFDVLSLANNHIGDGGKEGLVRTIEVLESLGIEAIGAGENIKKAYEGTVVEKNKVKVGFLACNEIAPFSYKAGENQAGSAWCSKKLIKERLNDLRKKADILVMSYHWGDEYTAKPNKRQREFGQMAIDSGADIVIGDHPHWVQSVEVYKGKVIFYSVGNLVFDQMWSEKTREGIILSIRYNGNTVSNLEIIPIKTMDYCWPMILQGKEKEKIINEIMQLSDKKSREWLEKKMGD